MIAFFGHDYGLLGCARPGTTLEIDFGMHYAPSAGLIARPVDQQPSVPLLCYRCTLQKLMTIMQTEMKHATNFGPWFK